MEPDGHPLLKWLAISWMMVIPNLYMGNGWGNYHVHPFKTGFRDPSETDPTDLQKSRLINPSFTPLVAHKICTPKRRFEIPSSEILVGFVEGVSTAIRIPPIEGRIPDVLFNHKHESSHFGP